MAARVSRVAWLIHAAFLAALAALYLRAYWTTWTGPPRSGFDQDGLEAVLLAMVLGAYASFSTLLVFWVGRRTWGPALMHTLLLGAYFVALTIEARDAAAREAELAATQ